MVRERVGLAITKSITVTLNHSVQAQFFGLVVIVVVFFLVPPLEVALIALLYYPVCLFFYLISSVPFLHGSFQKKVFKFMVVEASQGRVAL